MPEDWRVRERKLRHAYNRAEARLLHRENVSSFMRTRESDRLELQARELRDRIFTTLQAWRAQHAPRAQGEWTEDYGK